MYCFMKDLVEGTVASSSYQQPEMMSDRKRSEIAFI